MRRVRFVGVRFILFGILFFADHGAGNLRPVERTHTCDSRSCLRSASGKRWDYSYSAGCFGRFGGWGHGMHKGRFVQGLEGSDAGAARTVPPSHGIALAGEVR